MKLGIRNKYDQCSTLLKALYPAEKIMESPATPR